MVKSEEILLSVIIELLRISVELFYAHILLGKRRDKFPILAIYCIVVAIVTIPYFIFENVLINVLVTFIGCIVISLGFCAVLRKRIFYSFIVLSISVAIDFAVGYIFKDNPGDMEFNFYMSILSVLIFLLSALLMALFIFNQKDVISFKYLAMLILVLIIGIFSMIILERDNSVSRQSLIFIGITFLITDFLIFYIYGAIAFKLSQEEAMRELIEQNRIYEFQIQNGIVCDKKIRAFRHDIKNHMAEIYHFAEINDNKQIREYLSKLNEELAEATAYSATGVPALDGIINYKVGQAREKNIDFTLDVAVPENIQLSAYDMNILLGNLMDNAIEASENFSEVKGEVKPICLSIRFSQSCFLVNICNSYFKKKSPEENLGLNTTKMDKNNHGYGLKNVYRIVEKYSGNIQINASEGLFAVKVALWL